MNFLYNNFLLSLKILKKLNLRGWFSSIQFFNSQINSLIQGGYRYGKGSREQKYLTRLHIELQKYEDTGNKEHLINVANYCILESMYPEHENFHYDDTVESATRHILKQGIRDAEKTR